ncbi:MAG TPA: HAD family hydrolase [Candidatus Saccharimonadia bacterium]|nr:HAD family hydrolase [Candidatus Saccharimonadia bacterium]
MTRLDALISDADGTLIDTVYMVRHGLYETARRYLTGYGVPVGEIPSYEGYQTQLEEVLGGSARDSLERVVRRLYEAAPHHLEGIDYEALNALLDPIQDELAPRFVKAYPGADALLRKLGEAGMGLGIVTSGTRYQVVRNFGLALAQLGCEQLYLEEGTSDVDKLERLEAAVAQVFGIDRVAIITCEQISVGKPDPQGVHEAARRLSAAPERCAMMGDHGVDMAAGAAAGLPVRVAVTHGLGAAPALRAAGATAVVDDLAAVPGLLGLD